MDNHQKPTKNYRFDGKHSNPMKIHQQLQIATNQLTNGEYKNH